MDEGELAVQDEQHGLVCVESLFSVKGFGDEENAHAEAREIDCEEGLSVGVTHALRRSSLATYTRHKNHTIMQ